MKKLEQLLYYLNTIANNKDADQSTHMRRLICVFAIIKQINRILSWREPRRETTALRIYVNWSYQRQSVQMCIIAMVF